MKREQAVKTPLSTPEARKQFLKLFDKLCYGRSRWEVWADFVTAVACALANAGEFDSERRDRREQEYAACIERLGGKDVPAEMLFLMLSAMTVNPCQDFLGSIFMELNLGNHWKGQFFTPYNLCECMAEMTLSEVEDDITKKGWASVSDCACGAGATLIAAANVMQRKGIDFQRSIVFAAQDIDRIAGMMCFIQLSLLGCAGYVCIADALSNPLVGNALIPHEQEGQEFWYTPGYFARDWTMRKLQLRLEQRMAG